MFCKEHLDTPSNLCLYSNDFKTTLSHNHLCSESICMYVESRQLYKVDKCKYCFLLESDDIRLTMVQNILSSVHS